MFLPIIDGDVIPRSPQSLMADRNYLKSVGAMDRQYIIGVNKNEGQILFANFMTTGSEVPISNFTNVNNVEDYIQETINTMYPSSSFTSDKLDLLKSAYTYPRLPVGPIPFQDFVDLLSAILIVRPTVEYARALSQDPNGTNVYLYLFDHMPEPKQPEITGTGHGMEVIYEFDFLVKDSEDGLKDIFRTPLTQFAKTGNPTNPLKPNQTWPLYEPRNEYFMRLSLTPNVSQHLYEKRVGLWTEFVSKKSDSQIVEETGGDSS